MRIVRYLTCQVFSTISPRRRKLLPNNMKRCTAICAITLMAFCLKASQAYSCSWAVGYFYQVTQLRGTVVGMDYRGWPRWWRLRTTREGVRLSLYEYRWPIRDRNDLRLVQSRLSDKNGHFDFGHVSDGHYTLILDWPSGTYWFNVEERKLPRQTSAVKIDLSPFYPDCTGGHEFIIE